MFQPRGFIDRLYRRRLVRRWLYHQKRAEYYGDQIDTYVIKKGSFFHYGLRFFYCVQAHTVKIAPDERPTSAERLDRSGPVNAFDRDTATGLRSC